jgi:hypothetical protein
VNRLQGWSSTIAAGVLVVVALVLVTLLTNWVR